jgi:hypothetical protein
MVAVKVTGPFGGLYHYEYAVQNLDNHRGGASLRIPLDASATFANPGFHDIDGDSTNDWTVSRVGNEVSFLAAANNPLDWNTLYNFWFDCSAAPSVGQVLIDEARLGPGAIQVAVNSEVPSGIPTARVARVGEGCGGNCDSSYYELFAANGFDLANRSITHTLAGGAYTVSPGTGTFVAPAGTALTLGDDSEATVSIPFSLPYPGGSTTQLIVCSNGFISPVSGNGTTYTPAIGAFLAGQPRWAACWHDLNPASGGQVLVDASASTVRVSWVNVPNFSVGGLNTFQYQFFPNGTVHMLWGTMTSGGNGYIVGWTPGRGARDPGSRDLSALTTPFQLCAGSYPSLSLDASARPILGTTINLVTTNVPTGTTHGALLLGFAQASPPVDLTPIGMIGCSYYISGPNLGVGFSNPSSTVQNQLPIPNQSVLTGLVIVGQTFTVGVPINPLGVIGSNGLALTLGPQ